jgi:glutamine phosphoribosylpyrophosphate amidotransferase
MHPITIKQLQYLSSEFPAILRSSTCKEKTKRAYIFAIVFTYADAHRCSLVCMCICMSSWATHGGKTDKNAHPHMDYNNRIALVHNGTINNANELRRCVKTLKT